MEELIIHMAMSIVLATIKNPAKKEKFKAVLLKIRNTISSMYPGE
jgi:hypothetical protein